MYQSNVSSTTTLTTAKILFAETAEVFPRSSGIISNEINDCLHELQYALICSVPVFARNSVVQVYFVIPLVLYTIVSIYINTDKQAMLAAML